jgi:hypothetical protein
MTAVTYRCPRYQQTITLHITPSTPPVCSCKRHRAAITMLTVGGDNAA